MKDNVKSKISWNSLPNRTKDHANSDLGVRKFCELFSDPLFITREEVKNDYGTDVIIEILIDNGKHPTNIRSHAQIKSSSKKPNTDGSYSYSVHFSNLNYLLNNPNSFYVFYSITENKLLFCTAESVYKNYSGCKNVTVNFSEILDYQTVNKIHNNILTTNMSIRDLLLSPNRRLIINPDQFVYSIDETGQVIFLHNLIWENAFGKIPIGYEVYHLNNDALDNRKSNLGIRKTDTPFPIEEFQIEVNNAQITNILSILLEGDKAYLIEDVPAPPKKMLETIIVGLQNQGWNINEENLNQLKKRMKLLLDIEL